MKGKPEAAAGQRLCIAGYTEQEWVDYVLGKLPGTAADRMRTHMEDCRCCEEAHGQWSRLLGEAPSPSGMNHLMTPDPAEYPAERIRLALAGRVRRLAWLRRLRRTWLAGTASALAASLIIVLMIGSQGDHTGQPPVDSYVQLQEPAALAVLSAPDTSRYRMYPAVPGEGEGYIWLSGDNREAVLLLERLPEREFEDYQAWAVSGSRRDSLGLIKLADGRGHLYVRGDVLQLAEMIALSAEPKGGSRQPTSKQTLLLLGRDQ
ncbi:anti-sigma factor domain-containing protein [Paenibacillus sp. 1P07SE]|uniref:anti-sigma factor domain-containing protein n=1 Tax=Paenibacillus sp. 1P07SE TaxID=3132209 RepID=UPI0039A63376